MDKNEVIENLDKIISSLRQFEAYYSNKRDELKLNPDSLSNEEYYLYNEVLLDTINQDRLSVKLHNFTIDYLNYVKDCNMSKMTNNQSRFAKLLLYNRNIIQVGNFDNIYESVKKFIRS